MFWDVLHPRCPMWNLINTALAATLLRAPKHEPEALAGEREHKRSSWQPPAGYDPLDRRGWGQTAVSLRALRAAAARGVPVSPVDEGECANNIVRYKDVSGGQYRYEVPARLADDDPKILAMKRQLARLRGESA